MVILERIIVNREKKRRLEAGLPEKEENEPQALPESTGKETE